MNLYIPTTVSGSVTAGSYKDNAKTTIINAYGVDLSSTPKNSTVNIGGVQLTKTDGTSAITSSPATFVLVRAKDAAAAEALVKNMPQALMALLQIFPVYRQPTHQQTKHLS